MKGQNKINIIGRKILEIRYESFFLNLNRVCHIIALYFKLDNNMWYMLTSIDGNTNIKFQNEEPYLSDMKDLKNEFEYPISHLNIDFLNEIDSIGKIEEYLWQGRKDESCGLLISSKRGIQISVIEKDDCLYIKKGHDNSLLKDCILTNYDSNHL